VTATALTTAPPFTGFDGERLVWTPTRTIPFNVTGHPALSLPAGLVGGLPVGLQIVGPHGGEALICGIGHALERALGGAAARRRPVDA
jgi:aspartyl-tRNA(Asn)/glutamyl-tRNA(Gln) amidotransferase subunit A